MSFYMRTRIKPVFFSILFTMLLLSGLAQADKKRPASLSKLTFCQPFYKKIKSAPFPYQGEYGDTGRPFFDSKLKKTGEPAHTNRYGEKIPASRYQDNKVLFYIPSNFSVNRPFFFLVFFHCLPSTPFTDFKNLQLARQIEKSEKNLILIMPPLANNASDSSPGKFFTKNAFANFVDETSNVLSNHFSIETRKKFTEAPVVVSAFSGGYKSAAYVLDRGGLGKRLLGTLLFDAMFEDTEKFSGWLLNNSSSAFFLHIFGKGSCEKNSQQLAKELKQAGIKTYSNWPKSLGPSAIHFVHVNTSHQAIPLAGPPESPISNALSAIPGFNKQGDNKK